MKNTNKEVYDFVRLDEAAKMLDTSEYHTEMLAKAGKLKYYKLGEWIYIMVGSIKEHVANR